MKRTMFKKRAEMYEERFEELFARKCIETNKSIKKQLQQRMNVMRELQKANLEQYHNFKKANK